MTLRCLIDKYLRRIFYETFILSERKRAILRNEGNKVFEHELIQADITANFSSQNSINSVNRAAALLLKYGVVVIENFLPSAMATKAADEFTRFVEDAKNALEGKSYVENEIFLAQADLSVLRSYDELSAYPKAVLNLRTRAYKSPDAGMIDFFGFEKVIRRFNYLSTCYGLIQSDAIRQIIEQQGDNRLQHRHLNVYYNQSVVNTRVLHVDTLLNRYKIFLYLTDVKSLAQGPYLYVPGSFRQRKYIKKIVAKNRFYKNISATDMHLDRNFAIPIFGSAGTVLISNQAGVHGGFPQEEGNTRIVMVDNYS